MNKRTKRTAGTLAVAFLGAFLGIMAFSLIIDKEQKVVVTQENPYEFAKMSESTGMLSADFTVAAENTVHAVVHVTTESTVNNVYTNPFYEFFFGESYAEKRPVVGFGSGVIITNDGYIVTNNHVVEGAEHVKVTLNDKREYDAELVGTDPSTDLALLKIEAENLSFVKWGNSDALKVGEWVLAVGNPFNLTSTVTAGIVSAKGRNLSIIKDQYRIESFIQTDAALNRGNSGGALVNTNGELIGINTAIISPSGGYAGNSFAVPVSIVKKVVADLTEYGEVQRAILGVTIKDVDANLAEEKGLEEIKGVYIQALSENGAAKVAGVEEGDIVLAVNDAAVNSSAELQEAVSKYRPGDEVDITVLRKNKEKHFTLKLRNMYGNAKIVRAGETLNLLGAEFKELSTAEKNRLKIDNGVRIAEINDGKFKDAGVKEGFIITGINNKTVHSMVDVQNIINRTQGGIYIEGVYPNGRIAYYAFGL